MGVHAKVQLRTNIRHKMLFEQFDACVAAGLDLEKWFFGMPSYPQELKEMVVAWYELKSAISLHVEDARYKASK